MPYNFGDLASPATAIKPTSNYDFGDLASPEQKQPQKSSQQRTEEYSHRGADLPGAMQYVKQEDPTVDYSGIPDIARQAVYSLLDTPEEKTEYLKREYGEKNVTKSSYGQDVIIQDGKKIAFEAKGGLARGSLAGRAASLIGDIPATAGMIAGGMAGGIPGAGLGGMAGEAGKKLIKGALGLRRQTAEETASDIVVEGVKGAVSEGIGGATRLAGRTLLGPYEKGAILGPWAATEARYAEQKADLAKALKYGFTPPTSVYAPRAGFAQAAQKVSQSVFGESTAVTNKAVAEKYRQALIEKAGGATPKDMQSLEGLNLSLSEKADSVIKQAEQNAGVAMVNANQLLQTARNKITSKVGAPTGGLQKAIYDDIHNLKAQFSEQANSLYAPVDQYAGKPIVPTIGLKKTVNEIMAKRATTTSGQAVGQQMPMLDRIKQMPDHISFSQMQDLRHELGSMTEAEALNAGVSAGRAKLLAGQANKAFTDAVENMTNRVGEHGAKNVRNAVNALRFADDFYSTGIVKFQDLTINSLVKDATQHGYVQPEKITEFLVRPDQVTRLVQVKNMVSPETFQQVASTHWNRILEKSTDPITGDISGIKLASMLKGKENDIVFGKTTAEMRRYATQLAALNGKIDVSLLGKGNDARVIKDAIIKEKSLNDLVKNNVVSAIRSEGSQSLRAADYLTEPGNLLQYRQAAKNIGLNSPEMKATREYLARKIFDQMVVPSSSAADRYISTELSGKALKDTLAKYGDSYLNEVMGKEWTSSIKEFAEAAEIGLRKLPSVAGIGMVVSGGLRAAPFKHKLPLIKYFIGGEVWSNPTVIKYLSGGFKEGKIFNTIDIDTMRSIGEAATRTIIPYEVQTKPKQAKEYARGVQYKINEAAKRGEQ